MIRYVARSHPGCIREKNEDYYYLPPEGGPRIFAVADGMGGHAAGEVASFLSIQTLGKKVAEVSSEIDGYDLLEMKHFLEKVIFEANQNILRAQDEKIELSGMGTTFTVAVFFKDELLVGHVGDSQVHVFNDKGHVQVTEDHSLAMELLKNGEIKPEEVYSHPQRHLLTRALGTSSFLKVDYYIFNIRSGDYILLCTDGLTSMLRPDEIYHVICKYKYPDIIADELIKKANENGGFDNITIILVYLDKGEI